MNLVRKFFDSPTSGVDVVTDPSALSDIRHESCAGLIWGRKPLATFQSWLDALPGTCLPKTRVVLRPDAVREAMHGVVDAAAMPECPERAMLVDDVAALSAIFAEVMQATNLRLRLDVVTGNACAKFHIDAVTARLVCTYRGTGTQYGFATRGGEPRQVFTVPTGAPILLRGTLWPTTPPPALLHRSPPIEGSGETRLMLVLDPIFDLDEAWEDAPVH